MIGHYFEMYIKWWSEGDNRKDSSDGVVRGGKIGLRGQCTKTNNWNLSEESGIDGTE